MPDEGVDIRLRVRGGREGARDAKRVADSLDTIGKRARRNERSVRLFSRATASAGHGMRMTAGAALYGGAALGGALFLGLKRSTDAWQESRKVTAQTEAVLHSTRGAANVTAKEVGALATQISRKSGIDDEAVQSGENLLLTFKKVRNEAGAGNDIFNRASRAAVDLSAAGFGSISSTSKQLGKALNDPIKGITSLSRAGVTFTQGQKDRIEQWVKEGQLLKAQRFLLREVESQVGGSAAKQATALDRVKVSWGNIEEAVGRGASPAVDALADRFDRFFVRAEPKITALGDRLGTLFKRDDLTLEDKLDLAGADAQRTMRPFVREIRRELGQMDLGDKLGDAVEAAAPRAADAAGHVALRAAGAFGNAWLHAGLWGKLFTSALIARKLGLFTLAGRTAAVRFGGGFRGGVVASQYRGVGGRIGRWIGPAAGITVAALVAEKLKDEFGEGVMDILGAPTDAKVAADRDPSVRKGRQMMGDRGVQTRLRAFNKQHPGLVAGMGGSWSDEELATLRRLHYPGLIPGSPGVPRRPGRRARPARPRAHSSAVTVVSPIHIDGRKVATAVNHVNANERAHDRRPPGR